VLLWGKLRASGNSRHDDEKNARRGPEAHEHGVANLNGRTQRAPVLRRVPIRRKVAAAMALPLVFFIAVLGFEVRQIERDTDEVRRETELATTADGPSGLLSRLQDERNWAVTDLIGQGDIIELAVETYPETRRRTDEAVGGFRDLLERSQEQARQAFAPALDGLVAELDAIRARIDGNEAPHTPLNIAFANEIFDSYRQLIQPFLSGTTQVALAIDRPELRRGAELIDGAARQIELQADLGREVSVTYFLTEGRINERQELTNVSTLLARFQDYAKELRSGTTGLYAGTGDDRLFVDFTQAFTDQVNAAIRGEFNLNEMLELLAIPPKDSYYGYQNRVAEIVRGEARDLNEAATQRERLYIVVVTLTIAVAVATMVIVSRSITRPLQSLTTQAVRMASQGLGQAISTVLRTPMGADVTVPEMKAIAVNTRDEVADVAEVLNTVQHSALELAVGQAVLRRNLTDSFVSLGRRNQNLLSRQLDFLTELQQNETDADALGHLFQLDHLATRMRRNAESLLVLAINDSPRKWLTPVPITHIIRAAVSEVEHYQRVVMRVADPVIIVGSAAADLSHLLAELIDNALLYSPPDEAVEIRGHPQPAGYTLAILDAGVGMSPDEIARANRRLAGTESYTVAPSKYLGHYVAGNLAVRHNIQVRLHSAGFGTTATVHLPRALAALEPRVVQPEQPPRRTQWHAGPAVDMRDSARADRARQSVPRPTPAGTDGNRSLTR
jgi:HAMP domain/Histidine kinase-, DNA gyrase B-, and HSP90-like ATPase